jgi:hypothetical protein
MDIMAKSEKADSKKLSGNDGIMIFLGHIHAAKGWNRGNVRLYTYVTNLLEGECNFRLAHVFGARSQAV